MSDVPYVLEVHETREVVVLEADTLVVEATVAGPVILEPVREIVEVEHPRVGVEVVARGPQGPGTPFPTGTGSPEGVVVAPVGSLYTRSDGGPGTTLYVKEAGVDATGWRAV